MFHDFSQFIRMDKHRVKIGEPGTPVAAAEREHQVLVSTAQSFEVCDHDFTRFSLIHIDGSWYEGQVHVGLLLICKL